MGSKYIDLLIVAVMGYFAVTRVMNEQYGYAALFGLLAVLNVVSFIVKSKNEKKMAANNSFNALSSQDNSSHLIRFSINPI